MEEKYRGMSFRCWVLVWVLGVRNWVLGCVGNSLYVFSTITYTDQKPKTKYLKTRKIPIQT